MPNAEANTQDTDQEPELIPDAEEQALNAMFARDAARKINTALKFWFACPTRRCRRNRRCSGDPARCRAIFWPVVPDQVKAWWRALADAKREGLSVGQAGRKAGAAVKRWRLEQRLRDGASRARRV